MQNASCNNGLIQEKLDGYETFGGAEENMSNFIGYGWVGYEEL